MNMQLNFDAQSPAEQQLLAVSLVLMRLLRRHPVLALKIPHAVHAALPPERYGALLYDNLAAEHAPLEGRLSLKVHAAAFFEITSSQDKDAYVNS